MNQALPATTAPTRGVRELLEKSADRLAAALPKHLTPERVVQVVSTLVYRTPKLQACDPNSILAAVMRASSLGLDLEPSLCEAYLIPRWNAKARCMECQFQLGFQGIRKLVLNTGRVHVFDAELVRERDRFSYRRTPALEFLHEPCLEGEPGVVVRGYAYAKLAMGDWQIAVMSYDEIEAIRGRSQSPGEGPWATDWGEMAKKTLVRRLGKSLPRSPELADALRDDDFEYRAEGPTDPPVEYHRAPPRAFPTRSAALAHRLGSPPVAPAEASVEERPSLAAPGDAGKEEAEAEEEERPDPVELRARRKAMHDVAKGFGVFATDATGEARQRFLAACEAAGLEPPDERKLPNAHQLVRHLNKWVPGHFSSAAPPPEGIGQTEARRYATAVWDAVGPEARMSIRAETLRYLEAEYAALLDRMANPDRGEAWEGPEADDEAKEQAADAAERN